MSPKIIGFARTGLVEFSVDMAMNNLKRKYWGCKFTHEERIDIKTKGERIVSSLSEKL